MTWKLGYLKEAIKDLKKLPNEQRERVSQAIERVLKNPLPNSEGGYGKPLSRELAGCSKIKLKKDGIRVVYKVIRTETEMLVIVVGARADNEVYDIAKHRIAKYRL